MKFDWKKRSNCLSIGLVIIVILALAYSINLGIKQQETFASMNAALDRIIDNVKILETERRKAIMEKEELEKLEEKTTEDMKGLK